MKRCVLLLVLASLSMGCRVMGPGYRRPALETPAEHRGALDPAGAASLADLPWWEVYRDPVLQGLVREALAKNLDLRVACARVEQARALLGIAHADRHPQVGVELGASRNYVSDAGSQFAFPDRLSSSFRAAIGATWELDLWGRIRRASEAAWADMLASEEGRRAVVVTLVGDVAATYVELLALDWQLAITHQTVDGRTQTRDLFQKRLDGGLGSELEVARSAGDLAGAAASAPALAAAITQRENALSLLLGRAPGPVERGAALGEQTFPPQVPAGLPSSLLERRPDVKAAEHALHAAVARVGAARAARLPTLSLTGALGLESLELKDLLSDRAVTWSLGAGLVAPILDGGRLKASECRAWAAAEEAEAAWVRAALTAFRDVADALALVRHAREVTSQQQRQVEARGRALDLAFKRFEGGLSSYFEILDAQRDLFPAQLLLAAAKRDELLATVGLYRALGGGWERADRCPTACAPLRLGSGPGPEPRSGPAAPVPPAAPPVVAPAGMGHPRTQAPQAPPPAPPVADLGAPPAGPALPLDAPLQPVR